MSLYDYTFVALSTTPNLEGRHWVYLRAFTQGEAHLMADKVFPSPRYIFKLPTQRIKALANHVMRYGAPWIVGTLILLIWFTIRFRRSGLGFVVMEWTTAFGFALLFLATLIMLIISYLAILDLACSRAGSRALAFRSTTVSEGEPDEPGGIEDILDAYGPSRVNRAVQGVNVAFGVGLLLLVLVASFLR